MSPQRQPHPNPHYPQFTPGYRIPGTYLTVRFVFGTCLMSVQCNCGWWIAISCRKAAGKSCPKHCDMCRPGPLSYAEIERRDRYGL